MAYKIKFQLEERIVSFAVVGAISHHVDSIAKYVICHITRSRIENVLLDLRCAVGRPDPAKLFIHVLKYPFFRHINCALIDLEHNHEFFSLYLKLMRYRGHRIHFFVGPDEARAWLRREFEELETAHDPQSSDGIFAKSLKA